MFEPWIGDNYHSSPKPKTLILGESHYGEHRAEYGYELHRKSIVYVQDQIEGEETHAFYTKLASTFVGHRPDADERKVFWHGVAYHVLITTPLVGSRLAPSYEEWQASLLTLPEIIQRLKPDYVVSLGYRMWEQLGSLPSISDVPEITDVGPCGVRAYGDCYFHGIMHPSGPFSPSEWHGYIQAAKRQLWP